MPNTKNIALVEELSKKLKTAKAIYFTDYLGLDVAAITDLRSQFFKSEIEYRVAKNTLINLAAMNNKLMDLSEVLTGSTAMAISYAEPTAPAKILKNFVKKHEKPTVKGILFEGKLLDGDTLEWLANLPTRDESLAMLLVGLQQPMSKLAATLNAPLSNLVNVLDSLREQKS
ncbi:MAG: 50S ribosomal protein L10 [Candidatus Marinimicrobia bacterium]|nr:50S ribosomal protein L10 [Candidatus Neomarinimicrobiota bacterium]